MKAVRRFTRWFLRKETGVQLLLIFATSAILALRSQVLCQTPLTADGLEAFIPAAAAGGGGGGLPCTPSYANTGGTGDRTASGDNSVVCTTSGISGIGDPTKLVNSIKAPEGQFFPGTACAGIWIQFDFGHAVLVNESKYYQENASAQGTWKWQGSNNASAWTDIGSSFTLGGVATQTITALSANTTGYRYYRILGVSGNTSSSPWIYEFEFNICNTP